MGKVLSGMFWLLFEIFSFISVIIVFFCHNVELNIKPETPHYWLIWFLFYSGIGIIFGTILNIVINGIRYRVLILRRELKK